VLRKKPLAQILEPLVLPQGRFQIFQCVHALPQPFPLVHLLTHREAEAKLGRLPLHESELRIVSGGGLPTPTEVVGYEFRDLRHIVAVRLAVSGAVTEHGGNNSEG
jgi:hypothetical protein